MDMPPYDGQGEPVPAEFSLTGEWLIRDYLFFFRATSATPEKVTARKSASGISCHGFNVDSLAPAFGLSAAEFLAMNQQKKISVESREEPAAAPGASMRIVHTITDANGFAVAAPIEVYTITGRA